MDFGVEYLGHLKAFVNRRLLRLILSFVVLTGLYSCAGFETMSNEVRRGGWVLVAMGPTSNESFKPTDVTSATFTDSGGSEVDVIIRELLRVNPDPASLYGAALESSNGLGGNAGQLLAIVQIPNNPSIAEGVGALKLYNPVLDLYSEHELRILPDPAGLGPPVNNLFGWDLMNNGGVSTVPWLNNARPSTHVRLVTTEDPGFDPLVTVPAGALFRLTYSTDDFMQVQGTLWPQLRVVKKSSDSNLQLSWDTREIGGGVSEIIITLSNPHGFYPPNINVAAPEKTHFRDLSSVAIVWNPLHYSGTNPNPFTLDGGATEYFDIDGDTINFTASAELYEP